MKRSTDRILTTHAGSLSRPADLIALNRARAKGESADDAAYAQCLASAVAGVVRKQRELGVDIPDDGEFGKPMAANYDYGVWWNYAFARMAGFVPAESVPESQHKKSSVAELALTTIGKRRDWQKFSEFYQDPESSGTLLGSAARRPTRRPVCTAPIKYVGHAMIAADIANLKKAMAAAGVEEGFMCSIGPELRSRRGPPPQERGGVRLRRRRRDAGGIQGDRGRRHRAADRRSQPAGQLGHGRSRAAAAGIQEVRARAHRGVESPRCAACRRIASATTSAGEAGTARTPPTFRCRTSSTWC